MAQYILRYFLRVGHSSSVRQKTICAPNDQSACKKARIAWQKISKTQIVPFKTEAFGQRLLCDDKQLACAFSDCD